MDNRVNIAFVIDRMWGSHGGTEGQLLMLMNGLDKSRFDVHLVCLVDTDWLRKSRLDFPVKTLNVKGLLSIGVIRKMLEFRRYCRAHNIQIVQTYFNDGYIFGVLAARLAGIKNIIVCRRNLGPGFWGEKKLLYVFKFLKYLATRYLANSRATRDSISRYEGIDPDRIGVIYNGLDMERFDVIDYDYQRRVRRNLGVGESQILVGMVSHMRKDKNFELFLSAASVVHKSYPETRFIILGEGPYRPKIERKIQELKLEEAVLLTGAVEDVVPYLAAMDIGCLTTDGESFSNSILEYLAAGLPVVATEVGGNIEALKENGFLFPPGDLEALIESLSSLIEDKELRYKTGMQSKKAVPDHYGVGRMVAEYEAVYAEIMKGG